jgi:hypothetical protein
MRQYRCMRWAGIFSIHTKFYGLGRRLSTRTSNNEGYTESALIEGLSG